MQGASGTVEANFLGRVTLSKVTLGSITITKQNFNVLNKLPSFMVDNNIDGIIGLDVLKQATNVRFSFGDAQKVIVFDHDITPKTYTHTLPFETVGKLLVTDGKLNDKPVKIILDTGARNSIVSQQFVNANHLKFKKRKPETNFTTGIDEKKIKKSRGQFKCLEIRDYSNKKVTLDISDLAAFSFIGIQDEALLLGMDFFSQWKDVVFDFENNQLKLK